jgi:hypothetical protein
VEAHQTVTMALARLETLLAQMLPTEDNGREV